MGIRPETVGIHLKDLQLMDPTEYHRWSTDLPAKYYAPSGIEVVGRDLACCYPEELAGAVRDYFYTKTRVPIMEPKRVPRRIMHAEEKPVVAKYEEREESTKGQKEAKKELKRAKKERERLEKETLYLETLRVHVDRCISSRDTIIPPQALCLVRYCFQTQVGMIDGTAASLSRIISDPEIPTFITESPAGSKGERNFSCCTNKKSTTYAESTAPLPILMIIRDYCKVINAPVPETLIDFTGETSKTPTFHIDLAKCESVVSRLISELKQQTENESPVKSPYELVSSLRERLSVHRPSNWKRMRSIIGQESGTESSVAIDDRCVCVLRRSLYMNGNSLLYKLSSALS